MALSLDSRPGRLLVLACLVVPLSGSSCPDALGSGPEHLTSEEDGGQNVNVCLMQKAVAFENPAELHAGGHTAAGGHMAATGSQGLPAASSALPPRHHDERGLSGHLTAPAGDVHVPVEDGTGELWRHRIYPSLISMEQKHLLGPERTLRLAIAVVVFTIALSTGFCCMQSRAGSWLLFGVASSLVPSQPDKGRVDRFPSSMERSPANANAYANANFPPANSPKTQAHATSSPSEKQQPSTIFSGSRRLLEKLQSGEAAELSLGTRTGSMVLCVSMQKVSPKGGQAVKLEVMQAETKTPVASCMRQEGPKFDVWDAAGHFTGCLQPDPDQDHSFKLVQGSATPVLRVDITGNGGRPTPGLPTPGQGALAVHSAAGGTLGKLSLDEDDIEVTLLHSAMDSVVMVSLLGLFLLKK